MSRRTVLVAGATGYLGRYLTRALNEARRRVRVLVRDASKRAEPGPALAPARWIFRHRPLDPGD